MAKLKITNTDSSGQIHDRYTSQQYINGAFVGGTGGLTSQVGRQIQPTVFVTGGSSQTGSIIAQKGRKSFRVTDGTLTGDATLINSGTLAAGQMNLFITTSALTAVTANAMVVSGASTSAYVVYTAAGPVAPYVGQVVTGLSTVTGAVTVTAVNATGNVTVGYTSQTFANVAAATANVGVYASRITNKFVHDFGTATANPIKYRYHLATPDSTFVQVAYA